MNLFTQESIGPNQSQESFALQRSTIESFLSQQRTSTGLQLPQFRTEETIPDVLLQNQQAIAPKAETKFFPWEKLPFELRELIFDFIDTSFIRRVAIPSLYPSSSLPFIYTLSRLSNKFHLFREDAAPNPHTKTSTNSL
jgi:hypothetical protein